MSIIRSNGFIHISDDTTREDLINYIRTLEALTTWQDANDVPLDGECYIGFDPDLNPSIQIMVAGPHNWCVVFDGHSWVVEPTFVIPLQLPPLTEGISHEQ